MTWGEGAPARARNQPPGSIGRKPLDRDPGETEAGPDHWRDRAEEARARADRLRDRNIRTALLSIAEGFERLGLRAHDVQRSEPPIEAPQPAAVSPRDEGERVDTKLADRRSSEPNLGDTNLVDTSLAAKSPADTSLADTFRVVEALAAKPQPPATGIPDRIERVARALCQADGRDPDRAIETGQWETIVSGGLQTRRPVTLRGWKVYEKNARQFLAALDAAQDRS